MLNVIMLIVIMLNVIMLNFIMLNVSMLNVIMLNIIMLNVVMLCVVVLLKAIIRITIQVCYFLKHKIFCFHFVSFHIINDHSLLLKFDIAVTFPEE